MPVKRKKVAKRKVNRSWNTPSGKELAKIAARKETVKKIAKKPGKKIVAKKPEAEKGFFGKTMICLILDRSASMRGKETAVVDGVNKFIDDQKKLPTPASLAFVRFDDQAIERFRPMEALDKVNHLVSVDYVPRGNTPLLDAVGDTLTAMEKDWVAEKPQRAIVVIATDGEENASKRFTKAKVKEMIESRQNSGLWAFVFLGADIDAFHEASSMGIAMANVARTTSTVAGTAHAYATVSDSVRYLRSSGFTMSNNLGKNLGEKDEDDVQIISPSGTSFTATAKRAWVAPDDKVKDWTPPTS